MNHIVVIGAGGEKQAHIGTTYHYFEPREDSALKSVSIKDNVHVYPIALSDYKGEALLNITKKVSCSSFLEPNFELLKILQPSNWNRFDIVEQKSVQVDRLDNILDPDLQIEKLQIDTQGSELSVLKGCGDLLKNVKKIVCEVEFVELYKDQPLFSDIESYLSSFGFKYIRNVRAVKWNQKEPVFADALFEK